VAYWAAVLSAETYARERLYNRDAVTVDVRAATPTRGDPVVLVAALDRPAAVGLGRIDGARPCRVGYLVRLFDAPPAVVGLPCPLPPGLYGLDAETYATMAATVRAGQRDPGQRVDWQVSVHLPIEATSAVDAVREFWTYLEQLGPRELPTFAHPSGDELATRAYVDGRPAVDEPEC
jgi:hypothetical protein